MGPKEFNLELNIKRFNKRDFIEVVEGDYNTNVLNISLKSDNKNYAIDGNADVEIAFLKSNNEIKIQKADILNNFQGEIMCILDLETIDCPGILKFEARVLKGDTVLTTSQAELYVRKSIR